MDSDAELLFDHYEQKLGAMGTRWHGKEVSRQSFQIFVYPSERENSSTLTTFGLSSHHIQVKSILAPFRLECAICASRAYDTKALAALLFSVGAHILESHALQDSHTIFAGAGPLLFGGNPEFEHLYLATPLSLPAEFELCSLTSSPITFRQILAISTPEKDFLEKYGWSAFESLLRENAVDLLSFDTRATVA